MGKNIPEERTALSKALRCEGPFEDRKQLL